MRVVQAPHARCLKVANRGACTHFLGTRMGDGDIARRALLQQELARLDHRLGVEASAHHPVEQGVGESHDRHALVVRHVGAHDRLLPAFGQAGRREVDRLV